MSTNCEHEDITWEPVQMNYSGAGTAEVWQKGFCSGCGKEMILNYIPGEPIEA